MKSKPQAALGCGILTPILLALAVSHDSRAHAVVWSAEAESRRPVASEPPIVELDVDGTAMVSASTFHARMPAPDRLAAVRAAYAAADARLRARGADGAGATLWMVTADGQVVVGHDRYRFEPPGWLAEFRDDRISLAVGDRACLLPLQVPQWTCEDSGVEHGLPSIEWRAVFAATLGDSACGAANCQRLMVAEAEHLDMEGLAAIDDLQIASIPQRGGRRLVLDLDSGSGDPRRLHIIEILSPGRVAVAVYDFDLELRVEPFRLPF